MPSWAGIASTKAATRNSGGRGIRVERKARVSWLHLIGSGRSRRKLYSCRERWVGCEQAGEFPFPLIDYRLSDRRGAALGRPSAWLLPQSCGDCFVHVLYLNHF